MRVCQTREIVFLLCTLDHGLFERSTIVEGYFYTVVVHHVIVSSPSDEDGVTLLCLRDGDRERFTSIRNDQYCGVLRFSGARGDIVSQTCSIIVEWAFIGHDHDVGKGPGYAAQRFTFSGISAAGGTEDDDQAIGGQRPQIRKQPALSRGVVDVIDECQVVLSQVHSFQSSGHGIQFFDTVDCRRHVHPAQSQ